MVQPTRCLIFSLCCSRLQAFRVTESDQLGNEWLWGDEEEIVPVDIPSLTADEQRKLQELPGPRRVFTDIDDTMHCSNAKAFHGIDTNCDESHEIYPGVAQFQLELGLGPSVTALAGVVAPDRVVPISARPKQLKSILKIKADKPEFKHYENVGQSNGFSWGLDVQNAQYGSLSSSASVAAGDFDAKLPMLKYKGWQNVGPNGGAPSVFVGDNGQGDAHAAQLMMAHKHNGSSKPLIGAFIHHVQPLAIGSNTLETSPRSGSEGTREFLGSQGIHLFRNYGDAACIAYRKGFISMQGYGRVMQSILKECGMESGHLPSKTRQLCELEKPELLVNEKGGKTWYEARDADLCDLATSQFKSDKIVEAGEISASGGFWTTGFCDDLDWTFLKRLDATKSLVDKAAPGLSGYVKTALQKGLHCFAACGEDCDESSRNAAFENSGWSLSESGSDDWTGFCTTRSSSLCKFEQN